ncbi:MAG: imidazole glycerol phosphate synthase subunit HisH [Thermoguttaceae bacterium]|nr:imidazole glycerol phosphate synthase subunit HisH [Thermoguttaceae bacterium]MBR4751310.1 imidazole glycerol phosphate synthase subunit HisH [Thermoguttaceae bacterium]
MIAIIDYGMGNLRSVQKAFERLGVDATITSDASAVLSASKVVLPGVGAIADAITELKRANLVDAIYKTIESDKPFLGICLGFQALFEESEENGGTKGLGIFKGKVLRFPESPEYVVPHMGWNDLSFKKDVPIYAGIKPTDYVYFVHSYYVACDDDSIVATTTNYDDVDFCSSIAKGNVFGTQFHPEKSQNVGLKMLQNFAEL